MVQRKGAPQRPSRSSSGAPPRPMRGKGAPPDPHSVAVANTLKRAAASRTPAGITRAPRAANPPAPPTAAEQVMEDRWTATESIVTASSNPDRPRARSANYNRHTQVLEVEFFRGGTYRYFDVPLQVWAWLKQSTASFGRTFDRQVKGQYEYERISA